MTLQEIVDYKKEMLTCADVAEVLERNAYTIHGQAMERPELLGFPVIITGRRVSIPRRPFLKFILGEQEAI